MREFRREDLIEAYFACRKHKRHRKQVKEFEFNLERNLSELYYDILYDRYQIGGSTCFFVNNSGNIREIWSGCFRDKIVHYFIYRTLEKQYQNKFIQTVFNGIEERGTLKGAQVAAQYAKRVSRNYSRKAYYMKTDISCFFNSIDKDILFNLLKRDIEEEWFINLIKKVIYYNPTKHASLKLSKKLINKIPKTKRLHYYCENKGLAIGNLASQFFANIYLNELDQYVKHTLKCKYYCRYADDLILFHEDSGYLNLMYSKIGKFLQEHLALSMHPKKKAINLIEKGFDFIGYVIKPNRFHLRSRTAHNSLYEARKWKNMSNKFSEKELLKLRSKINSYLGLAKHTNNLKLREQLCDEICDNLFVSTNKDRTKIIIS